MIEFPKINNRIKMLVEKFCNGNVQHFVKMTGIKNHQNLNRIFNVDKRNGKYPKPSSEILTCIKLNLPQVNYDWLLTGEGEMLQNSTSSQNRSANYTGTFTEPINTFIGGYGNSVNTNTKGETNNKGKDINLLIEIEALKKEIDILKARLDEKDTIIRLLLDKK